MPGGTPAWVIYAALGTSILALLVSSLAARIAYLSYRASGPRLRLVVLHVETDPAARRVSMAFTVTNEGRGDVSIQGFKMVPYGNKKPVLEVNEIEEGPELPARIPGSSSQTWQINVLSAARSYDAGLRTGKIKPFSSWPSQFYFVAAAGNGTLARDHTHQYDARRLIADAYPFE